MRNGARVVVIGQVVARELSGNEDPLGKVIRMAICARRCNVLRQFMNEVLTLLLIGCGIGLLLGVGGALRLRLACRQALKV